MLSLNIGILWIILIYWSPDKVREIHLFMSFSAPSLRSSEESVLFMTNSQVWITDEANSPWLPDYKTAHQKLMLEHMYNHLPVRPVDRYYEFPRFPLRAPQKTCVASGEYGSTRVEHKSPLLPLQEDKGWKEIKPIGRQCIKDLWWAVGMSQPENAQGIKSRSVTRWMNVQ